MANENGRYVCCPLCEGKGQLHSSELVERLSDPQRDKRFQAYLQEIRQDSQAEARVGPGGDFDDEVHSWPPKRILWRRSPKE